MIHLLQFRRTSGALLGQTFLTADAERSYYQDTGDTVYVEFPAVFRGMDPRLLYWDGTAVQPKALVTLTVDKPLFVADGVDEARVTLSGLTQATSLLGVPISLLDPVLVLTADYPRIFACRVEDGRQYSETLIVEAR